jgi:multicomponent K+:H+ antiporter subunit F
MIDYALAFAFGCFGLSLLFNLYRVAVSPTTPDRVLALDTMVVNVIALMILYGMVQGTAVYFEASLLFAMTGFISTVAYAKFILRGDVIE